MTTFRIGQRVRIVACDLTSSAEEMALVGREAIVNELDCLDIKDVPGNVGVTVDGNPDWCFLPHQLEPLSDSNFLVSWESMRDLWVPEHLREAA